MTGYLPTNSYRRDNSFFREGYPGQENVVQMQNWRIDYDYIKTLNLKLVAGRNFDKTSARDSLSMIINESSAAKMNLTPKEAIGTRISRLNDSNEPIYATVIGVVKNFHFETLRKQITPVSFRLGKSKGLMAVKVQTNNLSGTISDIENLWDKLAPGQPFSYDFMDDSFNATYKAEQRLGKIFIIFTILSIATVSYTHLTLPTILRV